MKPAAPVTNIFIYGIYLNICFEIFNSKIRFMIKFFIIALINKKYLQLAAKLHQYHAIYLQPHSFFLNLKSNFFCKKYHSRIRFSKITIFIIRIIHQNISPKKSFFRYKFIFSTFIFEFFFPFYVGLIC